MQSPEEHSIDCMYILAHIGACCCSPMQNIPSVACMPAQPSHSTPIAAGSLARMCLVEVMERGAKGRVPLPMRTASLAGCCDAVLAGDCRCSRSPTRKPRPECKPPVYVPELQIRDLTAAHDGGMPPDVPSKSSACAKPVPAPRLVRQQELWWLNKL